MSAVDAERRARELQEADWTDLNRRLVLYLTRRLSGYGGPGQGGSRTYHVELAEEIAQDTIFAVLVGDRAWNPEGKELFAALCDIAKSKASHHFHKAEVRTSVSLDYALERSQNEQINLSYHLMRDKIADDPELVALLDAMGESDGTPRHLAALLSVSTDEVNNRRKRLRRRLEQAGLKPQP